MDKTKIINAIRTSTIDTVTIGSTVSKAEKEAIIKDFSRRVNLFQSGEIILVLIQR